MKAIVLTIVAAVVLMGVVVGLLAIGWLITGKNKLGRGTCGMNPRDKKKAGETCSLCGSRSKEECREEKKDDNHQSPR